MLFFEALHKRYEKGNSERKTEKGKIMYCTETAHIFEFINDGVAVCLCGKKTVLMQEIKTPGERDFCKICGNEILTEAGHVCERCVDQAAWNR